MKCIRVLLAVLVSLATATAAPAQELLARHYRDGETVAYHMTATNQNRTGTLRYSVDASGRVVHDSAGHFIDALEWSHLVQNDRTVPLASGSLAVQQRLGFAPGFLLPPDVAHADPRLNGPILDLFTFYVDWWLAARSTALRKAGDSIRVPGRASNSWADGRNVILGSDAVDFVITLGTVDSVRHLARILIQHVAPDSARVSLPAEWMRTPIAASPNNWVQIEANGGTFNAAVGHESFDVWLTVDLTNGQIASATMDNPVDVEERTCTDQALLHCGAPIRYRILRKIALDRRQPPGR